MDAKANNSRLAEKVKLIFGAIICLGLAALSVFYTPNLVLGLILFVFCIYIAIAPISEFIRILVEESEERQQKITKSQTTKSQTLGKNATGKDEINSNNSPKLREEEKEK